MNKQALIKKLKNYIKLNKQALELATTERHRLLIRSRVTKYINHYLYIAELHGITINKGDLE